MSLVESDKNNTDESMDENIPEAKHFRFTSKETFYFKTVDKFFKNTNPKNIKQMIDIIEGNSKISLRLLDWFVTKYSNMYKISYKLDDSDDYNVHISYKAHLKSYKKRNLDPFRRRKKFFYSYKIDGKSEKIATTIGQLNFFRWSFINGVIKYVEDNYDVITKSMILSNKSDKKKKRNKTNKTNNKATNNIVIKKNGINIKAKKDVEDNKVKILLSFD